MPTVLLTGAGGAAVPSLIEHLRARYGFRVIAVDMDPYAAGLFFADQGYVVPSGKSAQFQPTLLAICQREAVEVVIPLVDEELLASLSLREHGIAVILPTADFIELCLDKYKLMQALHVANISNLPTYLSSSLPAKLEFPLIVKPRTGRGSVGVKISYSLDELQKNLANSEYTAEQLIIQPYVRGKEFTVSVVVDGKGSFYTVVPKEIILKKGITRLAVTRRLERLHDLCHAIQTKFQANGPYNVQLRIDEKTGQPLIFEINPRFSTTVSLTIAAGVDEVGGLIQCALGKGWTDNLQNWVEGKVLVRRQTDFFMEEPDFLAHRAMELN